MCLSLQLTYLIIRYFQEMRVRKTIYEGHWREIHPERQSLWLHLVLTSTCGERLSMQARLLFITFGPIRLVE